MPRKAKSQEAEAQSPEELIQPETEPKKRRTLRKKEEMVEEQIPIPELTPEESGRSAVR